MVETQLSSSFNSIPVLDNNQFSIGNLRWRQLAAARSRAPRGRSAGATQLGRKMGLGEL